MQGRERGRQEVEGEREKKRERSKSWKEAKRIFFLGGAGGWGKARQSASFFTVDEVCPEGVALRSAGLAVPQLWTFAAGGTGQSQAHGKGRWGGGIVGRRALGWRIKKEMGGEGWK